MNILFIHLPLADHFNHYLTGNIPYGPSSIAAYARRAGLGAGIEILPFQVAGFGSNRFIARYAAERGPDMVAFTCFCWNLERNLAIAKNLRGLLPGCRIAFGGPEIAPGSHAMAEPRPEVDVFVGGEGEWFFRRYLEEGDGFVSRLAAGINGNLFVSQPDGELLGAGEIVEPFTNGFLDPAPDGSTLFELVRGCPHRCLYCFYSKSGRRVRQLPPESLVHAVREGWRRGVSELYVLAPSLNEIADITSVLGRVAAENPGVALHSELRAGGIDRAMAGLIRSAGFRSLEVGLQSTNQAALRSVRRNTSPELELAGMAALREAGIGLTIGVIPGLPGDTPDSFAKTLELLAARGFAEETGLYPLMVLPGTGLRDLADGEGAVYQRRPPYHLVSGWGFDFDDLRGLADLARSLTGHSYAPSGLPDFSRGSTGPVGGILVDAGSDAPWDGRRHAGAVDTAIFQFRITHIGRAVTSDMLLRLVAPLGDEFELAHVIFLSDLYADEAEIASFIERWEGDSLHRRLHAFDDWAAASRVRFWQVFGQAGPYARALEEYGIVEPILRPGKNTLALLEDDALQGPRVLVPAGLYETARDLFVRRFRDAPDDIAFESESDMAAFYRDAGLHCFEVPFSFRILRS